MIHKPNTLRRRATFKRSLQLPMATTTLTPISKSYRKRASALGKLAESEDNETTMFAFLQQALMWIQLAENEELLVEEDLGPH